MIFWALFIMAEKKFKVYNGAITTSPNINKKKLSKFTRKAVAQIRYAQRRLIIRTRFPKPLKVLSYFFYFQLLDEISMHTHTDAEFHLLLYKMTKVTVSISKRR